MPFYFVVFLFETRHCIHTSHCPLFTRTSLFALFTYISSGLSSTSRVHKIRWTEFVHAFGHVKRFIACILIFVFCSRENEKLTNESIHTTQIMMKPKHQHLRTSLQASSVLWANSLKWVGNKVSICCRTFDSMSSPFLLNWNRQNLKTICIFSASSFTQMSSYLQCLPFVQYNAWNTTGEEMEKSK